MDDSEECGELLDRCLAAQGDSDSESDLKAPPVSGNDYLRRVQSEARQCPTIVVADVRNVELTNHTAGPGYSIQATSLQQAPKGYAPSIQWQREQTANFSQVRLSLEKWKVRVKKERKKPPHVLPYKEDFYGWCTLCFGRLKPKRLYMTEDAESTQPAHSVTTQPTDSVSTQPADSVLTQAADSEPESSMSDRSTSFEVEGSSFKEDAGSLHKFPAYETEREKGFDPNGTPPLLSFVSFMDQPTVIKVLEYHVNWFEATGFTLEQGRWFYALLASLEKPLDPEAHSLLRTLARNCAVLRATLETPDDTTLPSLNLLVCLVARYFDQTDLADT